MKYELKLRNSATGRQTVVAAASSRRPINIYSCGPTVYDRATLGNLRTVLLYDTLARASRWLGHEIHWVMNYTDVGHLTSDADSGEDKVAQKAVAERTTAWDIANRQIEQFERDLAALRVLPANAKMGITRVRATEKIAAMQRLVLELHKKGVLYQIDDGLYFDTKKFPPYGRLAGGALDGQREGARVTKNPQKRQGSDFAVWKFSKKGSKRDMEWKNPLKIPGFGFPGWHLECSTIIWTAFGKNGVDVHAGGVDLRPIHHQNELAQSETAYGKPFVKVWLHGEHLLINGGRMGKSEGNQLTVDDLTKKGFSPLDFRYLMATTHYRSKLNFTWSALAGARAARQRLDRKAAAEGGTVDQPTIEKLKLLCGRDLNLPEALAKLWEHIATTDGPTAAATIKEADSLFAFLTPARTEVVLPAAISHLISEREQARQQRDFSRADALRQQLLEAGYEIEDTKEGPVVKPNPTLLGGKTTKKMRRRIDAAVKQVIDEYGEMLQKLGDE